MVGRAARKRAVMGAQVVQVQLWRADDTVQGQHRHPRRKAGPRQRRAFDRPQFAAQGHQPAIRTQPPFVEIAHHKRRPPIWRTNMPREKPRLHQPRLAQQAQMRRNQPQGLPVQADVGHDRTPRLQPRQGNGLSLFQLCPAQQKQVPMPAMRCLAQAVGQCDRDKPRLGLQIAGVQHTAPVTKAAVHLLQRNNIRPQLCNHLHYARGITAHIGSDRLVNVVRADDGHVCRLGTLLLPDYAKLCAGQQYPEAMKEPLPKGQPVPQAEKCDALVIGAGPAGLMAAEVMARAGRRVTICEAKPSPARKFLMAGKSGLNLLNAAPLHDQITTYTEAADWLAPMLRAFGPQQIHAWAEGLGQPLFTGSSGRVFPHAMKASPLLRAWLARLDDLGVTLRRGWRWTGGACDFATQDGPKHLAPRVTVLALGGASWARLGSDGVWRDHLTARGIACTPFQPTNMGFSVAWSDHMTPHFGQPIKGVRLMAGTQSLRAEFVLTARGVEGGGIYALSRPLREGAALTLDLFPDLSAAELDTRLARRPAKESRSNRLRKALGLSGARLALVNECARSLDGTSLKALPLPLGGPHPMDEAISTAGGIARAELDATLMLRKWPGTFAAGEMLDWEAPTGGYLLTACLATGHWAGTHSARYP